MAEPSPEDQLQYPAVPSPEEPSPEVQLQYPVEPLRTGQSAIMSKLNRERLTAEIFADMLPDPELILNHASKRGWLSEIVIPAAVEKIVQLPAKTSSGMKIQ